MNKFSVITGDYGGRLGCQKRVYIDGVELTPFRSFKFREHSPDGFLWGYNGSGPAQLSLALLLEATTPTIAVKCYQDFKSDIIAGLKENFTLNADVIYKWLEEHSEK